VVVRSTQVDVGSNIVRLDGDCLLEVSHGLAVRLLALESVTDVVEELGVVLRHLEARVEDGQLILPVPVPCESFGGKNGDEKDENG